MSGDDPEAFEIADNQGSTVIHGGANGATYDTITTSSIDVPKTNTKRISGYCVRVGNILGVQRILVSYDGGTTFQTFKRNEAFSSNLKGEKTVLKVKTNTGTVLASLVEFIFNLEVN